MTGTPNGDAALAAAAAQTTLVQWTAQLRADLAESFEGTLLRGARAVRIGAGGTARPATSPTTWIGLSVRNTTAGAGNLEFYDGDSVNDGLLVGAHRVAASQGPTIWFGPGGINLSRGLFVVADGITLAEFIGCVYLRGSE